MTTESTMLSIQGVEEDLLDKSKELGQIAAAAVVSAGQLLEARPQGGQLRS